MTVQFLEESAPQGPVSGDLLVFTAKAVEMVGRAAERDADQHGRPNHQGGKDRGLRVGVTGGGCSGMQYQLAFEEGPKPGDSILDIGGVPVFVDSESQQYLHGMTIDYVSGLHAAGFKFVNPNAARTCGCGTSFSTEEA